MVFRYIGAATGQELLGAKAVAVGSHGYVIKTHLGPSFLELTCRPMMWRAPSISPTSLNAFRTLVSWFKWRLVTFSTGALSMSP